MTKFKAGDVVKLVNIDGLYSSQSYGDNVPLELGETYPVVEVDGNLIRVVKSNGEIEGCYPYRVELVAEEQTAESLKELILSIRQEREQTLSKLKDLDTQEAEAILQLNALGFSLFEEGEVNSPLSETALSAEYIEEDMTDPKNWKVGDMIECVCGTGWDGWIDQGEVAELLQEVDDLINLKTKYGIKFFTVGFHRDFKFHSRSVK